MSNVDTCEILQDESWNSICLLLSNRLIQGLLCPRCWVLLKNLTVAQVLKKLLALTQNDHNKREPIFWDGKFLKARVSIWDIRFFKFGNTVKTRNCFYSVTKHKKRNASHLLTRDFKNFST
jgi:hypothetical protein